MIKGLKLVILLSLVVLATTFIPDKNVQTKVHHKNNARKSAPQHRQNPSDNCNLICPGQPPLHLPSNFLHNCTPISNTQTTTKATVTSTASTTKPSPTTTNSTSTEESDEESSEEDTDTSTSTTKSGSRAQSRKLHKQQHQIKKSKKHNGRKRIRKERILLNKKAKSKIFKHKQMQGKTRLDGCYVICSDANEQPGNYGPPINPSDANENEDSSSEEDDNYVPGEDTPIEIIYLPQRRESNARPLDFYQTNNYWNEMWQPEPAPPFGYDPFFFEEKKKNTKKIKKKSHDKKKPNKHT